MQSSNLDSAFAKSQEEYNDRVVSHSSFTKRCKAAVDGEMLRYLFSAHLGQPAMPTSSVIDLTF